jgi:hypothetical protein
MYLKSPYIKRLYPKQMKRFCDYLGIPGNKNNSSAAVLAEEQGLAFLDKAVIILNVCCSFFNLKNNTELIAICLKPQKFQ